MADIDPSSIQSAATTAGGAGGALAAIIAFLFNRHVKRIDSHEARISEIEGNGATEDDIESILRHIEAGNKQINDRLDRLSDRADKLYEKMVDR